ncbi:MAG: hypothetical protein JOZ22_14410 [Acidobacteriia bacterium]|nr:hypothetical protein [Terriglobia bacterium]
MGAVFWPVLLCLALSSCGTVSNPSLEHELAISVPADTLALAGVRFDQMRNQNVSQFVPANWLSALKPFRNASVVWAAYNGKDLLLLAAGNFSKAPSGTVLVTPHLALAGSETATRAAAAQYATGRIAAQVLLSKAAPVMDKPLWAVARGDTPIPITGNLGNLNRMLRYTEYATATFSAKSGDSKSAGSIDFTAYCASAEPARQLEESLRAIVTLASAVTHSADRKGLLESILINREMSTVRVQLPVSRLLLEQLPGEKY